MSRAVLAVPAGMVCPMSNFSICASLSAGVNCGTGRTMRGEGGFAYLWTLLLVAFIGVGLVIVSEVYSTSLQREREQELIFIGREFRNAVGRYYESSMVGGQRQYPATLEDLLKDPRFPNVRRYLRRIYVDPMTGKREWGVIRLKGRIVGIHSQSDRMPIKQDNFEVLEANFRGKTKYSEWVFTYPPDLMLMASSNASVAADITDRIPGPKLEQASNIGTPTSSTVHK